MRRIVLAVAVFISSYAVAGAASLPEFDVDGYCGRISEITGGSNQIRNTCIQQEQAAYDAMKASWSEIPERTQSYCSQIGSAVGGSYNIMHTCIQQEMGASEAPKFRR